MNISLFGLVSLPLWVLLLPAGFVLICVFMLFACLARSPKWFSRLEDRHELAAAVHEILAQRRARGEISDRQYDALRKDTGSLLR